jgi:hypothetical protein
MSGLKTFTMQCAACGAGSNNPDEVDRAGLGTNISIFVLLSLLYGCASIIFFKVRKMMRAEDAALAAAAAVAQPPR